MEPLLVYNVSIGYVYLEEGEGMREHQHDIDFVAESHAEAIDAAVAWSQNRYEAYFKDAYKNCEIGSLKLYQKWIGIPEPSGFIPTHTWGCLFEWKYDWPGTLSQYVSEFKSKHP